MTGFDSIRTPVVFLLVLSTLVLVTMGVGSVISTANFSGYNPTWDGTSTLREWTDENGTRSNVVLEPATYRSIPANDTLVFVVAPDTSQSDSSALRQFVHRGGTVVVMDDRGNGTNQLLASLGADARIDGTTLRDERHNYHSPAMPIAQNVSDHPLTANVERVTLNYGTAVQPNDATPLVSTSNFSYLDVNANRSLDGNEQLDSYPVATVENVSDGRVVVVGDPSIAVNSMLSSPGNEQFLRGLIAAHDRTLFDETYAEGPPPLALALIVVRRSLAVQLAAVGALAVLVFGVRHTETASAVGRRFAERAGFATDDETVPIDDDEIVTAIKRRYPSWSRNRIERIVRDVRAGRKDGETDD